MTTIVEANHRAIWNDQEAMNFCFERGISLSSITRFSLGSETRKISKLTKRLLFPMLTVSGTFLGFQGRVLNNSLVSSSNPKYWHQTYDKPRFLYGLHENQELIQELDFVVLLEGNIDVVTLWQCGIPAVAKQGGVLSKYQASLIRRYTKNVVDWADNDDAGIKASKAQEVLLNEFGCEVYKVQSKRFKDANELYLAEGVSKVRKLIYG